MIDTLINEFLRLFQNIRFWGIVLLLLAVNIMLLFVSFGRDEVSYKEYSVTKEQMKENSDRIVDLYFSDMESPVYKQLYEEYVSVSEYDNYLDEVQDLAENNNNISIFQTGFSVKNISKTADDFRKLKGSNVKFVGGYGMEKALSFKGTDVMLFFSVLLVVTQLILYDKKSGMLSFFRTTYRGGKRFGLAKITMVSVFVAIITVIMEVSNIAAALKFYGNIELNASVQSLSGYARSGMQIDIMQLLVLTVIFKVLIFIVIGIVLSIFAVCTPNIIFFYLSGICFCGLELLLFLFAGALGSNGFPGKINVFYYMDSVRLFQYFNYDLFGNPVHQFVVNTAAILLGTLIGTLIFLTAFAKSSLEYVEVKLYKKRKKVSIHSLWHIENYKYYIGYRAVFVLIALIMCQGFLYYNKTARWYKDAIYYQYYMKSIEGDFSEEKVSYIREEAERLDAIYAEYMRIDEQFAKGEINEKQYQIKTEPLSRELERLPGFTKCQEYVDYIIGLSEEEKGFVYDRGWNYLAGNGNYKNDMQNALVLMMALILGLSFMYAEEYHYKMNVFLDISAGRKRVVRYKNLIAFIYIVLAFCIAYVPDLVWTIKEFGLIGGSYPVHCLMKMRDLNLDIQIGGYFVLVYCIRFLTAVFLGYMIMYLGKVFKNSNVTILVSCFVILVPIVLNMLGINALDRWSFNYLLSGNMLFGGL